ncbi:hypothetical protein GN958_ATG03241 [Phytophthora infestans]|uniref:Uncharacterized protein n=1 Tax=Phytophthora infestans TaxID=4787 RepID=A0A8S9V639_PHYIN|nr:hypothetical protein GN958_ATG03241 [Phytophthora infestans]
MEGLPVCHGLLDAATGSDSDDEFYRRAYRLPAQKRAKHKHGGSSEGKRADRARGREQWGAKLVADYLADKPTYNAD